LQRPEAEDHDVAVALLAHRFELRLERLADAIVLLLPGERHLDARPFGQVDLPDAVADVLDARRAEEREVHEGVAVERPARSEEDVGGALRQAFRAHRAAREEVLVAVLTARAVEARRLGRIAGNGEVALFDGDASPRQVCHAGSEVQPRNCGCQSQRSRAGASTVSRSAPKPETDSGAAGFPAAPECTG